jgi:hypothetical protein
MYFINKIQTAFLCDELNQFQAFPVSDFSQIVTLFFLSFWVTEFINKPQICSIEEIARVFQGLFTRNI